MDEKWGKWIIVFGIIIVVIGLIIRYFGKNLGWIGNLPGDIRIERENFKFYFPITSLILLSLVVNVLLRLVKWLR
jgi:hypothetical protein